MCAQNLNPDKPEPRFLNREGAKDAKVFWSELTASP
jgi:hypothetical protein